MGRLRALAIITACVAAAALAAPPARADAVRDRQWYLSSLGVQQAWTRTRGAGVVVGVVDSGVDGRADGMRGSVVGGRDFSGRGGAGAQTPVNGDGHGTAVASLLAARGTGTGSGVIGVAPQAQVLSASVLFGSSARTDVARAIRWTVDHGATVVNLSLGVSNATAARAAAAAIAYAQSKDVVVVAASGNSVQDLTMSGLAILPGVVGVTGVDQDLRHDPAAVTGQGVAISAPYATTAGSVTSARGLPVVLPRGAPGGPVDLNGAGTSLATPIVAGVIALIRARYPDLDAANVVNRLLRTATPVGGSVPNPVYGYGVVDAARALAAEVPTVRANPLGGAGAPKGRPVGSADPTGAGPTTATAPDTSAPTSASGPGAAAWVLVAAAVVALAGGAALLSRRRLARGAERVPTHGPPGG